MILSKKSGVKKIILDCDIGWVNDDATALIFAAKSPKLDVLGVTPVAGNFDLPNSVESALKILEEIKREDIPVYPGFDRPIVHKRSDYADKVWGKWAKELPINELPGGPPKKKAENLHASDYIGETILTHPGEITLIATGPLTNVAASIRKFPTIVEKVRDVIIMGGNIPLLPRGHGNITPAAEFNFWVDPEAASIVLNSGMNIHLCPLNVCRLTHFKKEYFDRITKNDSSIAKLYRDNIGPYFKDPELEIEKPRIFYGLYDSICIAYVLKPDLFRTEKITVTVDTTEGFSYGASYGYYVGEYISGKYFYPLADFGKEMTVVWDVDFEEFADLWLNTILDGTT